MKFRFFKNLQKALLVSLFLGVLLGTTLPPLQSFASTSYYTNVSGSRVHVPTYKEVAPIGASAKCKDNTYSFSVHRRGTCSHHGGVARWL